MIRFLFILVLLSGCGPSVRGSPVYVVPPTPMPVYGAPFSMGADYVPASGYCSSQYAYRPVVVPSRAYGYLNYGWCGAYRGGAYSSGYRGYGYSRGFRGRGSGRGCGR